MRTSVFGVLILLAASQVSAQRPLPKKAVVFEERVGTYHVITSQLQPSPTTHRLTPQPGIQLNDTTADTPQEYSGTIEVPSNYIIDDFENSRYDCIDIIPQENGCVFIDYANLSFTDSNHIYYHIRNHGGRVLLLLNISVRDLVVQNTQSPDTDWHANQVISVNVSAGQNVLVQGIWNDNAVFFVPGQQLSEEAQKAVQVEGTPQTIGSETIYSYRVKDPGWALHSGDTCVNIKAKKPCEKLQTVDKYSTK